MATIKQKLKILSPQPSLTSAGTPQLVSTSKLVVSSYLIEAQKGNSGYVYIGDSIANTTSTKGVALAPGDRLEVGADNYEHRKAYFDLNEVYFDGDTTGNKLVVSYAEDQETGV